MIETLSKISTKIFPQHSDYQVVIAKTPDEIESAQRLRFQVFNLELNEGLDSAYVNGLDEDLFDQYCDHLLVIHLPTAQVVGTYRMQTGLTAKLHIGYYSAQEFDFTPYESIRSQIIELGRACIDKDHRNFFVLNMLWRGIAEYATQNQARYLLGCSSLTSQKPAEGAGLYAYLSRAYLVPLLWRTVPHPDFRCPLGTTAGTNILPPKLLRAYLGIGARICGPPALDREFKTIDFLTMLDLNHLSLHVQGRLRQHRLP